MAQFTLITALDVLNAMGQDPALLEDSKPAIESALQRAIVRLEGMLKGELGLQTVTDTFYLEKGTRRLQDGLWRLRLSNPCIRKGSASVGLGTTIVSASGSINDWDVDLDKGMVTIPEESITQTSPYVSVAYRSGFSPDDDPCTIPEPLKQAMLCFTPLLLLSASSANAEPKQQASELAKANSMDAMAEDMLPRFLRNYGLALKPVRTVRQRHAI